MIYVNIVGGLGNQMFQYAFGRSLSLEFKKELGLYISEFVEFDGQFDLFPFYLNKFNVSGNFIQKTENILVNRIIREINPPRFQPELLVDVRDNNFYYGYWQSEGYFKKYRSILLDDFIPVEDIDEQNEKICAELRDDSYFSVGVHVRRGDRLRKHIIPLYNSPPISFYEECANKIKEKNKEVRFFIFGDDPDWAKDNLGVLSDCKIIDCNKDTPWKDIMLLSLCDALIFGDSTFAWWGAWLNINDNSPIYCPSKMMRDFSRNPQNIFPERWNKVSYESSIN